MMMFIAEFAAVLLIYSAMHLISGSFFSGWAGGALASGALRLIERIFS